MKEIKRHRSILMLMILFIIASCGPVVISSRPGNPPPSWFYPNRLEIVRYVYFPEFSIYYDLSARTYLYFDKGVWVRRNVLPPRFGHIDLRHSRYERIRDYHDENIQPYHDQYNANRGRSNRNTARNNKSTTRRRN